MAKDTETSLHRASDSELAQVLTELVESGQISADAVNARIMGIRGDTALQANCASKIKERLTQEQIDHYLSQLEIRFTALPKLHEGVEWNEIAESLRADPNSIKILNKLDKYRHKMNVFGIENGEFIFVSAWDNVEDVHENHRNIVFYKLAERFLSDIGQAQSCNGNATDIAEDMGANLAYPQFDEQLRGAVKVNGWAWLKTDSTNEKAGFGTCGLSTGIIPKTGDEHNVDGSFRAEVRVKKV